MDILISSLIDILTEIGKSSFLGIRGKIKVLCLKYQLKRSILREILSRYENEIYYNDLDHFLTDNDVICQIIRNCIDTSAFHYKPKSQTTKYYVQLFIEQHPKYSRYHYDISSLIEKYFKVIFNAFNKSDTDATRVVCNVLNELIGELSNELLESNKRIEQKIDLLHAECIDSPSSFSMEAYYSYLLSLYPAYSRESYLPRKIYEKKNTDKEFDVLDTLLVKKNVLLLGEAGFGKTFESIVLLNKVCQDNRTNNCIPLYFPLYEYGLLYNDILSGIKRKIDAFSNGNSDKLIVEWMQNGKLIFIFDGIDDISQEMFLTKFFADVNDIAAKYRENLFFFTSRFNRYHGELSTQNQYFLSSLDEQTIRHQLREEGIIVEIPKEYYQLFSNPLFLSIGKKVLKKSSNHDVFNRSQLFDELFQQLYGGLEQKKGISATHPVTYSDALSILGEFAFENISQSAYGLLEFDQKLTKIIQDNKVSVISSFISSGLFKISDSIQFIHKLLKEYCVAHYLINTYPLSANIELYRGLVQQGEWKEVFIFAGGIFKEVNLQDEFLDFVMSSNLSLYIECINAKSDLRTVHSSNKYDVTYRLLSQIYKTYIFIISHYLHPIMDLFQPLSVSQYQDKKIGIIGCLSNDGTWLSYWFDLVPTNDAEINCVSEQQLQICHKEFEKNALHERRNIASYGVNMKLSGLPEDSGRKIAIDLIKKELKSIIEKKQLIESKYLLCERVTYYQRKIKEIKDSTNLLEMQATVDGLINEKLQRSPNMAGYNYNGIELLNFQHLLHFLNASGVILQDYLLPESDIISSGWIWDLYSKEQKKKRITLFFYYHDLSYLDMVKNNFPKLCCHFSRFQDAPYQNVVAVNYKENDKKRDFSSEPSLSYYYIAALENDVPLPLLHEVNEQTDMKSYEFIIQKIRKSFLSQGKTAHRITYTQTGFSFTLTSRRSGSNDPLSDYVYDSIRESLEEIFGSLK